jgi:hypothetical protein
MSLQSVSAAKIAPMACRTERYIDESVRLITSTLDRFNWVLIFMEARLSPWTHEMTALDTIQLLDEMEAFKETMARQQDINEKTAMAVANYAPGSEIENEWNPLNAPFAAQSDASIRKLVRHMMEFPFEIQFVQTHFKHVAHRYDEMACQLTNLIEMFNQVESDIAEKITECLVDSQIELRNIVWNFVDDVKELRQ